MLYTSINICQGFFSAGFIYWTDNTNRSIYHIIIFRARIMPLVVRDSLSLTDASTR